MHIQLKNSFFLVHSKSTIELDGLTLVDELKMIHYPQMFAAEQIIWMLVFQIEEIQSSRIIG